MPLRVDVVLTQDNLHTHHGNRIARSEYYHECHEITLGSAWGGGGGGLGARENHLIDRFALFIREKKRPCALIACLICHNIRILYYNWFFNYLLYALLHKFNSCPCTIII